jgi:hypothetical protein
MKYTYQRLHSIRKGESFTQLIYHFQGDGLKVRIFNGHVVHTVEDMMSVGSWVKHYMQAAR